MSKKAAKALKSQRAAFRKKFGRDAKPSEPVFFDPDADTPQAYAPEKASALWESICDALASTGIDPAIVHAARKTKRILTNETYALLSPAEQEEWDDAIDEYREKE